MVDKIIISAACVAILVSVGACLYMNSRVKDAEKKADLYSGQYGEISEKYGKIFDEKQRLDWAVEEMKKEVEAAERLVKSYTEKVHEIEKGRGNSIKEAEGIISTHPDWADSPLPDGLCEHIRARCADGDGVQDGSIKAPVDSVDSLQPSKGYAAYD